MTYFRETSLKFYSISLKSQICYTVITAKVIPRKNNSTVPDALIFIKELIEMTILFPTNIPPPDRIIKHLDNLAKKLENFNVELCFIESIGCFWFSIDGEQPTFTKVIVIPVMEFDTHSKSRHYDEKIVASYIVNSKFERTPIRFSVDILSSKDFRKKLMMFKEYGLMTDKDYTRLYALFMSSIKHDSAYFVKNWANIRPKTKED